MKNLSTLLFVLFIGTFAQAQDNVIDRYFSNYEEDERFSKVKVSEKSFQLFSEIETKDAQEQSVIESIKKLKGIKGLFQHEAADALDIYKSGLQQIVGSNDYEELVSFSNPEHNAVFMIRETEETIQELMVMFNSVNEFGLVTLFGEIDLKRIKDLAAVIEKNGEVWFEAFENISNEEIVFAAGEAPESKKQSFVDNDLQLRVFPNPAVDFVNLEAIKGGQQTYEIGFYSLIGEPILQLGQVNLPYKLALKDVPAGAYFIRITNDQGDFKNYKIVKR